MPPPPHPAGQPQPSQPSVAPELLVGPAHRRPREAPLPRRGHTGRWHSRQLRSSAGFETVQTRHFGSLAFTPLAGGPSGRRAAPPFTTSTTAWNKPRCTTRFSSTPRPSPPKPKTLPAPTCRRTPKAEFDTFLQCGILAHGFLRLRLRMRCSDCGHDKLAAFSCERRGPNFPQYVG